MRRVLIPLSAGLVLAATAAPALALEAPGRVAYGVSQRVPVSNVDAGGADAAVALPNGGVVAAGGQYGKLVISALTPSGALDRSLGHDGVTRPTLPVEKFTAIQVLRRLDGDLRIVGETQAERVMALPQMAVLGLHADGSVDRSYGTDGLAQPGIEIACGGCAPAAFAPDGSLLLAGGLSGKPPGGIVQPDRRWLVARLTADGKPDTSFGDGGVAAVPGTADPQRGGYAVGVGPGGRIISFGRAGDGYQLVALTATGAPDPGYHGGTPVSVPVSFSVVANIRPDGRADVVTSDKLLRFTPDGEADAGFGNGGSVALPPIPGGFIPLTLEQADGSVVIAAPVSYDVHPYSDPDLRVLRLTPDGHATTSKPVDVGIDGGLGAAFGRGGGHTVQRSFLPAALLPRPNGGVLLVGGAKIAQYTGEGSGFSTGFVAAAALGSNLQLDRDYGGSASAPRVRLRVPRQHARSDYLLRRVLVRAHASTPGLLLVRVRDGHGRILAQEIAPVYEAGEVTLRVPLTHTGRNVLRHGGKGLRVRVGHDLRGLLDGRTRGVRTARLR